VTIVAIDFGTSNTIVSFLEPDTQSPKTLRFGAISRIFRLQAQSGESRDVPTIPTLVFIRAGGGVVLGQQVRLQRLGFSQPERLFKAFKQDLVADFQPPPRQLDGQLYDARRVGELLIEEIWQQLEDKYIQPSQLIFTVPVGAFERYLDWFRDLGRRLAARTPATSIPIRLVDESTAAALGYAVRNPGAIALVVDFGGGTLDLSLVRTASRQAGTAMASPTYRYASAEPQTFQAEVLAKSDAYVGGEDIDSWIVDDYLRRRRSSRQAVGEVGWQNLLEIGERLKIRLSQEEEAKESWLDEETFTSYDLTLSREQLEEILERQQFLEQLRQTLDEVLEIAQGKGIGKREIEQVILVGGSCLIPAVRQLITSYFGKAKVKLGNPFEAVCHGALALSAVAEVEDYLRHSYAIRLWEPHNRRYSYFVLFEQGSRYPCTRAEPLLLQVATDGQTEIRLDIGEVAAVSQAEVSFDERGRMTSSELQQHSDYRSLDSDRDRVCAARLDPPGQMGVDRIAIAFEVDRERVLRATVEDLLTQKVLVDRGAIAKLT